MRKENDMKDINMQGTESDCQNYEKLLVRIWVLVASIVFILRTSMVK